MSVTITPAAEAFMRQLLRMSGAAADAGFRLVVTPGGCAGMISQFTVESAPPAGDVALSVNGMRVFVPRESCPLLDGATVDFGDTGRSSGFRIINPNMGDCGCGSTTPGRGGRHAVVNVSAIQRVR